MGFSLNPTKGSGLLFYRGWRGLCGYLLPGVLQKGDASVDMVVVLARTLSTIRMEDATATKVEDPIRFQPYSPKP